eukprot:scaffold43252_cov28-Tisochrysis_lutea.AAC.3
MDALLERPLVRREGELLCQHNVVIEQSVNLIRYLDDTRAGVAIRVYVKVERGPCAEHVVERLLDGELLHRAVAHLLDLVECLGFVEPHALGRIA